MALPGSLTTAKIPLKCSCLILSAYRFDTFPQNEMVRFTVDPFGAPYHKRSLFLASAVLPLRFLEKMAPSETLNVAKIPHLRLRMGPLNSIRVSLRYVFCQILKMFFCRSTQDEMRKENWESEPVGKTRRGGPGLLCIVERAVRSADLVPSLPLRTRKGRSICSYTNQFASIIKGILGRHGNKLARRGQNWSEYSSISG